MKSTLKKDFKNVPFRLDELEHRKLKVYCAEKGIAMQQLMEQALDEYMKKRKVV
jgi:predicted HicB family RNase H-like nuclease